MLKKLAFLAAFLFIGGTAKVWAEAPIVHGFENYRVYKATPVYQQGGQRATKGAYLQSVIISTPSQSPTASLSLYNSTYTTSAGDLEFSIQMDTVTLSGPTRYDVGIFFSSGIYTNMSSLISTGSAQLVFTDAKVQQDYRVWQSSFIVNNVTTHTIFTGPGLLHKIIVLKKGAGTCVATLHNQVSTITVPTTRISALDLSTQVGEYIYNVYLSSGLQITSTGAGSTVPEYLVLFKQRAPISWEGWNVFHATGPFTNRAIFAGRGVVGGVMNGDVDATGLLTMNNSYGTSVNEIGKVGGGTQFGFFRYDVYVSSGLTVSNNTNTAQYSIFYKRLY